MVSPVLIPVASLISHGGVHEAKPNPAGMVRQRPTMKDRDFLSCSAMAWDKISRVDLHNIIYFFELIRSIAGMGLTSPHLRCAQVLRHSSARAPYPASVPRPGRPAKSRSPALPGALERHLGSTAVPRLASRSGPGLSRRLPSCMSHNAAIIASHPHGGQHPAIPCLFVHFAPVANPDHQNAQLPILNAGNNPVLANAVFPE